VIYKHHNIELVNATSKPHPFMLSQSITANIYISHKEKYYIMR